MAPCPMCDGSEVRTAPGELGYGTEVYCATRGCGFMLARR